jgi:rod shape-determining protein MreD
MRDVVFWLTQDLLTVLMSGTVRMPEIFLLNLVYRLLADDRDTYVSVIWTAFFGGLLWDLRWVGIPFFTLCYVVVVMMVMSAWNNLPSSGRTAFVIFLLFWTAQLLPAVLSVLILERGTGSLNWTLFWVQQGCAVPVSLLGVFFYFQREKNRNA